MDIAKLNGNAQNRYYQLDYNIQSIIDNILDRFEDSDKTYDSLIDCLNDELIYYSDMWAILEYYCLPQGANWEKAIEEFLDDLYYIAYELIQE